MVITTRKVAIYCRISQDREGAGLGVARQEEDCRALCERRQGWDVVDVYPDNDVGAYSGKPRPEWNRLMADVKAGQVDAIVAWHVDRLTRSPRELEDIIELADKQGLELATVTGEIDLATPTGRMIARMLGAAARHEMEHKAERQRRQHRQAAEAGKVGGGGFRPFGYADDRVTIIEDEAQVIREVAKRLLAKESQSSICRDLLQRDVRTPTGGHWQPRTLRRLMASARISGRREHTPRSSYQGTRPLLGEITGNAVWPAIITDQESDDLRRLLSDPDRSIKYNPATGRSYLLSGILRCDLCQTGLVGRPRSGVRRYVCPNEPGGKGCGRIATNAERTDSHVRDMVLIALESPEVVDRIRKNDATESDHHAQLVRYENMLEELAEDWALEKITKKEWMTARAPIEAKITKLQNKADKRTSGLALLTFVGPLDVMLDRWKRLNTSQRRAIVTSAVRTIQVQSANPRKKWDPDRFEPDWIT